MSAPVKPVPADKTLDAYFLELRCRLLDVAAVLDRINRGSGASEVTRDPRLARVHKALEVLQDQSGGRAERIQQIFSREYDPNWERPKPR